ncbi:MAG: hypothetical protein IPJ30_16155 [Acidobacteria bacterium]|nr:hypothetical protein [Acidobacteriota bacterium]
MSYPALDVVEHLKDDDIAGLREMHRVLKRAETPIFVPAFMVSGACRTTISKPPHTLHGRNRSSERLEKAGFKIERAMRANRTFFAPILAGSYIDEIDRIETRSPKTTLRSPGAGTASSGNSSAPNASGSVISIFRSASRSSSRLRNGIAEK